MTGAYSNSDADKERELALACIRTADETDVTAYPTGSVAYNIEALTHAVLAVGYLLDAQRAPDVGVRLLGTSKPLDIDCPLCDAKAGERCLEGDRLSAARPFPHAARMIAALGIDPGRVT